MALRRFWVLAIFILVTFMTGGGSRGDIQSLVILRPVSALMLGYALWRLKPAHLQDYSFISVFALLLIVLVILHLVPLPPSLWASLPGRALITDIDAAAGLGGGLEAAFACAYANMECILFADYPACHVSDADRTDAG